MSKKMFMVLALTVVFVFAASGAAFAAWGDNTYGTGFVGNPHGGYLSSSTKCGVCHAVHGAATGGEALLQSSKANSCTYCHITSGLYKTVYLGLSSNYSVAVNLPDAHNTVGGATLYSGTVGCPDCHTVHGAGAVAVSGAGTTAVTSADNLRNLFTDARGASFRAIRGAGYAAYYTAANATTMTQWCSQCHPYYNTGVNGKTHRMVASDNNHAFTKSSECRDCHDSVLSGAAYTFPHIADGARFLKTASSALGSDTANAVADASGRVVADGACLKCHVNAGVTSGVGVNY